MERFAIVFWFMLCSVLARFLVTSASVVLIGNNVLLSFDDVEANFGEPLSLSVFLSFFCFLFFQELFLAAWMPRK
uniref:Uncharacterized protein n=1 Tax=Rhizophora mucronata TaxID=61149 RepID=A0A2P2J1Q4_RHIMU